MIQSYLAHFPKRTLGTLNIVKLRKIEKYFIVYFITL